MARRVSNEPAEAQPGTTKEIPLDWIIVEEAANQRRYSPKAEEVKDLANSILQRGLINPLTVRELSMEEREALANGGGDGDKRYKLVAGYQRMRALLWLGEQQHPGFDSAEVKILHHAVPVVEGEPVISEGVQNILVNLDENLRRTNLGLIDKAVVAKTLITPIEEGGAGMSQLHAAKHMRVKPAMVSQLLTLLTLRPEVQRKINEGVIQFSAAREFPNIPEKEQDRLIKEAEDAGKSVTGTAVDKVRAEKGKAKSTRGRKAKGDKDKDAGVGKGISAKKALAAFEELGEEIEEQEGGGGKAGAGAVEIVKIFAGFLGGKFGVKSLKNKLLGILK